MHDVIETIGFGFGLPTDSHISAVQAYNARARDGHYENYGNVLRGILGIDCQELENPDHARIQVGYVISIAVEQHVSGNEINPNSVYVEATAKARDFAQECSWAFAKKEEDEVLDEDGNVKVKSRKGDKQRRAAELYQQNKDNITQREMLKLFMDELDMSTAGARTYVYNNKKVYGPCKQDATAKKGPTKSERAFQLYMQNDLSKQEFIELFVKELNTSKAGAQTMYYAARRKAENG